MATLTVKDLTFTYKHAPQALFNDLSFTLHPQTTYLFHSPSGSGKSTLFKLLCGLDLSEKGTLQSGQILIDETPLTQLGFKDRSQKISLLFQDPARRFALKTLTEQLTFIFENLATPPRLIPQKITKLLTELELIPIKDQPLNTLSGGQQQQAALACALALDSEIILLDEPFANVDFKSQQRLLKILMHLKQTTSKTLVIAEHDPSNYGDFFDETYQLVNGKIAPLALEFTPGPLAPLPHRILQNGELSWHDLQLTRAKKELLKASTFTLPKGQLGLLSGPNGAGKSSLFYALSRLISFSGTLLYKGRPATKVKRSKWPQVVGLMLQDAQEQFVGPLVKEELALAQKNSLHKDYWTTTKVTAASQALGLTELLDHSVYQLSGGQQKKLQFLSVLITSQPILLLDEPFANLDQASLATCLTLLTQSCQVLKTSILLISHQRSLLKEFCDYELVLTDKHLELVGDLVK